MKNSMPQSQPARKVGLPAHGATNAERRDLARVRTASVLSVPVLGEVDSATGKVTFCPVALTTAKRLLAQEQRKGGRS